MNPEQQNKIGTSQPTVVLIDNSHAMQSMLRDCLLDFQVSLLHYNTVEEADRYLHSHQPDIIFLSLLMPDKNGLIYLRELRQQIMHRYTQVVIVTSKDYEQDRGAAQELGVSAFLVKPMPMQELTETVRTCIEKNEADIERTLQL